MKSEKSTRVPRLPQKSCPQLLLLSADGCWRRFGRRSCCAEVTFVVEVFLRSSADESGDDVTFEEKICRWRWLLTNTIEKLIQNEYKVARRLFSCPFLDLFRCVLYFQF